MLRMFRPEDSAVPVSCALTPPATRARAAPRYAAPVPPLLLPFWPPGPTTRIPCGGCPAGFHRRLSPSRSASAPPPAPPGRPHVTHRDAGARGSVLGVRCGPSAPGPFASVESRSRRYRTRSTSPAKAHLAGGDRPGRNPVQIRLCAAAALGKLTQSRPSGARADRAMGKASIRSARALANRWMKACPSSTRPGSKCRRAKHRWSPRSPRGR